MPLHHELTTSSLTCRPSAMFLQPSNFSARARISRGVRVGITSAHAIREVRVNWAASLLRGARVAANGGYGVVPRCRQCTLPYQDCKPQKMRCPL